MLGGGKWYEILKRHSKGIDNDRDGDAASELGEHDLEGEIFNVVAS